jgi:hypothetical protein
MPSKRTASRLPKVNTPTRTKLEDDVIGTSPIEPGSDNDSYSPALRRSPRKRQRVEPEETKTELVDDESTLSPADSDEYDEKPATKSTAISSMGLGKFAYSSSRPKRAVAKTPSKQHKLEETATASAFSTDNSKLEEIKPNAGSQKVKASASPSKKPATSSPRKQKAIVMELEKPHPAPPNWEKQYALIEEMRAGIEAPVDTMGCAKSMTGEGPLKVCQYDYLALVYTERNYLQDQRFGTLVSLMLSSQTKDEVTSAAVTNLRRVLPGGLTIESLLAADPSVISEAIGKV